MGTYTKAQLETELTRIKNAVASCRTAIYNKGVTSIPANVTLAQLPTYVNMIECSHPDILLKYIANGTANSNTRRDVYFDTGIYGHKYTTFTAKYSRPVAGGDGMLFGADDSVLTSFYFIPYYGTYAFWMCNRMIDLNWRTGSVSSSSVGTATTSGYTIPPYSITYAYMSLHGSSYTTASWDSTSYTSTSNKIYLFARNKGSAGVDCKAYDGTKIYYIAFYEDGKMTDFFIPVLHWNNGSYVPCFYNKCKDTYIYNLGSDPVKYESYGYSLCDSIYYNTRVQNTSYGFITGKTYALSDSIHVRTSAETFGEEQFLCGYRYPSDGNYKNCVCYFASNLGCYYPYSSGCIAIQQSTTLSAGTIYNVSRFTNSSTVYVSVNNAVKSNANAESSNSIIDGKSYYLLGNNGNVFPNTRLFYACICSRINKDQFMYVPILDGSTPKFIDLNTGNKIAYNGTASAVSYDLLD